MERRNLYKALLLPLAGLALVGGRKAAAQTTQACSDNFNSPYDPRNYGWCTTASGADNAAALSAAVAAASAENGTVTVPSGAYNYTPTAPLQINCNLEGQPGTLIYCQLAGYTGDVFRLVNGHEIRSLALLNASSTPAATGIRICAAGSNPDDFSGHQRMTRVYVKGFDRNIQADSTMMLVLDQVRSEYGNEGFYCAPSTSAGYGYVTTHMHQSCWYFGNRRNIYYNSPINSKSVTFIGGTCEGATGPGEQAWFNNIMCLQISSWYVEGAGSIPGIRLASVNATVNGLYMENGAGGIYLHTNAQVMFSNVVAAGTGNTLKGGDGTQWVQMQQCFWPGSGNSTSFAHLNMTQVQINGAFY